MKINLFDCNMRSDPPASSLATATELGTFSMPSRAFKCRSLNRFLFNDTKLFTQEFRAVALDGVKN